MKDLPPIFFSENRELLLISQNVEARAVMQDIASYENTQETLVLLKILALGNQEIAEGKVTPLVNVARHLRSKKITEK